MINDVSESGPLMPPMPMPGAPEAPLAVEQVVGIEMPKTLDSTRRHKGTLFVAGEGVAPAEIMFLASALQEEEAQETVTTKYGSQLRNRARYLKGPSGSILTDLLSSIGMDIKQCYYTSVVKWLLPRNERMKPKKEYVAMSMALLEEEIKRVKPKVIVAFGKTAFETLVNVRLKFDDIRAGWFWSEKFQARVFVMQDVFLPVLKPELAEKFRTELLEVKKMWQELNGITVEKVATDYRVIRNSQELIAMVEEWRAGNFKIFSTDTEGGGRNFLDMKLRSVQFCWKVGVAAYIRFMDDQGNYVFDISYREAGKILGSWLNQHDVKFIGHHWSFDAPILWHWLGIEWYEKLLMDTEFAEQTLDENAELGLERVAIKYTDLGRYDIDLVVWKSQNAKLVDEDKGYLFVPDEILIPYGCRDVDAPFRAFFQLMRSLMWDKTWDYYCNYRNKLVGDIFTNFAINGLPIRRAKLDELRKLYSYARTLLEKKFIEEVVEESRQILSITLLRHAANPITGFQTYQEILKLSAEGKIDEARNAFKRTIGATFCAEHLPVFEHFVDAPVFNLRSPIHKPRWLFQVKKLTPVKSTANKAKNLPSIPWERVMRLAPNLRKDYSPATDKQSLKLIADDTGDPLLQKLLDVLAVGNVCKAFLKEAELDDEGNLVKENGLHYWIASDGRIHGQNSCTETGRPRSWRPNSLNWPSYVHEGVARGIAAVLADQKEKGMLPPEFERYVNPKAIPSIRSVVDVTEIPPVPGSAGWVLVESDYATAEIRGLAFLSGDVNLIRLMTEPDTQFGIPIGGDPEEDRVRLGYDEGCGIPVDRRDQRLLWKQVKKKPISDLYPKELADGELKKEAAFKRLRELEQQGLAIPMDAKSYLELKPFTPDMLMKNEDGSIRHPSHDLHWSLCEWVYEAPREFYEKKIHRAGTGKVGNFSSAYGATANTLERKIKADTGKAPEPGTGQKILDSLANRQPDATKFLEGLAMLPQERGYYQAESGAKRRFVTHGENVRGLDHRTLKGIYSHLGREARNFPMQNSVADTAVRAGKGLMDYYRSQGMYARVMAILYDSVVTLCPLEERFIVMEAHEEFMTRRNCWHNHGRTWNYPSAHELNFAWSERPKGQIKEQVEDRNWNAFAPWLQRLAAA